MSFMSSIVVHLLLIYSNDLKIHICFYSKDTKDLAGDELKKKNL